ncbi:MAG TPA: alpha/beta fold hydrolase [Aeromicrobium sp.]|nr:alpha/beta fold hydrolase [Aeromicrobium sp.]
MVLTPEHSSLDDINYVVVHGYRRAYRVRGAGPPLLLIHGLACDSTTWLPVMDQLAEHFTVIAPDLLGHGESDKPNADYSLGGFANGMRDLLTILGIDKVTVVGHSFGGGVAMQFAYQFPERTERVVLVSTGGLGHEVTPLIRALTLPGVGLALRVATIRPVRGPVKTAMRTIAKAPLPLVKDLDEVADVYERLADPAQSLAIRRLTRTVLDWRGQFVTMSDRAYLAKLMPIMVIWGRDDVVIPVDHAQKLPSLENSQVFVFDRAGHFPHKDHPEDFSRLLVDFCQSQPPAAYHRGKWRRLLTRGDQAGLATVELAEPSPASSPSAVS